MTEFKLEGEYIELIKLLKLVGLCQTGGQAKAVTGEGLVKVDGMVETRKKKKIRREQVVDYDGKQIKIV